MLNKVTEKWKITGLLNGLDEEMSHKVAIGLENEARWLIDENNQEYNELLIPLTKLLLAKIEPAALEVAELPAFLSKNGTAHVVMTLNYTTKISSNDLKNPTPERIEELAASLYKELLIYKGDQTTICLYTPIMLGSINETTFGMRFRGEFFGKKIQETK